MKKAGIVIVLAVFAIGFMANLPVMAISDERKAVIKNHCDTIRDDLKKVQRNDSRTRVYLGGYYETILTKFITALNLKMVEGNLSNASLVENQNRFASMKTMFSDDFVNYQKSLEELIAIDCKTEQDKFYDKLVSVRKKRRVVEQDVTSMKGLINDHIRLVNSLLEKM